MDSASSVSSRLRWRCRRGMRELDVLLSGWLEQGWPDASPELQGRFETLLACEDDQIWDWLMGRSAPQPGLEELIEIIGQHHRERRAD